MIALDLMERIDVSTGEISYKERSYLDISINEDYSHEEGDEFFKIIIGNDSWDIINSNHGISDTQKHYQLILKPMQLLSLIIIMERSWQF